MKTKKLSEKETEKVLRLVKDIRGICIDRLDAVTADGLMLSDAFKELETLLTEAE